MMVVVVVTEGFTAGHTRWQYRLSRARFCELMSAFVARERHPGGATAASEPAGGKGEEQLSTYGERAQDTCTGYRSLFQARNMRREGAHPI